LEKWCARASPKDETFFAATDKIAEHYRYGRMQVHLTESVRRLRSLDSTFPYGLCNGDFVAVEVIHFETEQFACSEAASRTPLAANIASTKGHSAHHHSKG